MEDLEPLDADIQTLLASEKPIEELAPDRKAALFAAACTQIGGSIPSGGGSSPGPSGSASASSAGKVPGTGTLAKVASNMALHGVRGIVAIVTTFAIGIGTGVGVDRALTHDRVSAPATVVVGSTTGPSSEIPVAALQPPPTNSNVPVVSVESLPRAVPSAQAFKAAPSASHEPVTSPQGLAAERALLDVARGALAAGDPRTALDATERHEKSYPDGMLVEEREALVIKALAALGRTDEALTRARVFEQRYPNSLLRRAVHTAVFGSSE